MKDSCVMWKIFSATGYIDAYLYYRDLLKNEDEQAEHTVREVVWGKENNVSL